MSKWEQADLLGRIVIIATLLWPFCKILIAAYALLMINVIYDDLQEIKQKLKI